MEKVSADLENPEFKVSLEGPDEGSGEPPLGAEFAGGIVLPATPRAKTSLRLRYEAESEVIRKKLGDLETIRGQLGLSQRKIAQLLLVDPSAWTRWTKAGEKAPPHVYRMLQWYLALQEKYPALDVNFWLNTVAQRPEIATAGALADSTKTLLKEIAILKARIAVLESASESGAGSVSAPAARVVSASHSPSHASVTDQNERAPRIMFFIMIAAALAALVYGFFA
ncbi:MAG: hypothetical protein AAB250_07560 [Bdellovibrionota bacterium]